MNSMWRTQSSRKMSKPEPDHAPGADANDDDLASNASTASNVSTSSSSKLPPGWTKKESKSQKGRYYYISPSGKTQWVPPAPAAATGAPSAPSPSPAPRSSASNASSSSAAAAAAAAARREKVQVNYNWIHEIEIEFGEGRLGVSLREVRQLDSIPYPQFQAEVDDLPKVNGKAGPAELYNWSVKPHRRLTIGMRITFIDATSLAGFTYKEVVDKLKRAPRPVKLRFADVDQGTVEDNPEAARQRQEQHAPTAQQAPKKSKYLEQKQAFTRVLVTSELHTELWSIETKKLDRQRRVLQTKWDTVSREFDALNARRVDLQKDHDKLLDEKQHYSAMIKQLKAQENHEVGNPLFITANDLAKRHAELTDDITKMGSGNKRLRKERVTLQLTLDELENELSKLGKSLEDDKHNDDDLFFGIDPNAPPADQLAALRKKMRFMDDELVKEQRKATKVEKEMEQLNRHLAKLSTSSSSSSSGRPRNDTRDRDSAKTSQSSSSATGSGARDSARSTDGPSDVAALEMRILDLRKKQRTVVEQMSKAAKDGDKEEARECQKKRKAIKDELARAQDKLQALKAATADDRDEPSRGADRRKESSASAAAGAGSRHPSSATAPPALSPTSKSASSQDASSSSAAAKKKPQAAAEEKMPTLSGFLDKGPTEWSGRGLIRNMKTMRGARERWCEICEDGKLRYYKRRGDPEVRGEIDLADASFEVTCEDMQRGKEFVLCTSDQQSHFFTKSTDELLAWVRTLRAANAFLKTSRSLDSIASKLDAADRRHGGGGGGGGGGDYGDDDEQFYGRATLGF